MTSTTKTQNYPLAVALLNSQKKKYRKKLLEEINDTKEFLETNEKMLEETKVKLWRRCLKAELKLLTYIFNKNKEESFKGYKKCQEVANSLLEYCMNSTDIPEVETLHIAKVCKAYHETKKNCVRVAIKLDNEIGYWK